MKILVCGAGGFIGSHLVKRLKSAGHYVVGADLEYPEFWQTFADEFHICDLRDKQAVSDLVTNDIDEIYQLAADMGGAGYIFVGNNDANILHNNAKINLNIVDEMVQKDIKRIFYSSSACVYPKHIQIDPNNPNLQEESAYPANPDSEYGWEKIFSERLYLSYARNYNLTVRIARFHNIFGPYGPWRGGKEKAPAAICRKIFEAQNNGVVDIWGTGLQTRSFLYIDDCLDGIAKLMNSSFDQPLNLGSDRLISINDLVFLVAKIAKKNVSINNIPGPVGVTGRNSHNELIKTVLGWSPPDNLELGLKEVYTWIESLEK